MRARRATLGIVFLIVFVDLVGFGIVIPILPTYAEDLGPSPLVLGLLMASFSVMQLLATPVLGRLSDRYGRRPVLLVSLLGSVAGYVLFAVADSLPLLFLSRIVDGFSGATSRPPRRHRRHHGAGGPRAGHGAHRGRVRPRLHLRPRDRRATGGPGRVDARCGGGSGVAARLCPGAGHLARNPTGRRPRGSPARPRQPGALGLPPRSRLRAGSGLPRHSRPGRLRDRVRPMAAGHLRPDPGPDLRYVCGPRSPGGLGPGGARGPSGAEVWRGPAAGGRGPHRRPRPALLPGVVDVGGWSPTWRCSRPGSGCRRRPPRRWCRGWPAPRSRGAPWACSRRCEAWRGWSGPWAASCSTASAAVGLSTWAPCSCSARPAPRLLCWGGRWTRRGLSPLPATGFTLPPAPGGRWPPSSDHVRGVRVWSPSPSR